MFNTGERIDDYSYRFYPSIQRLSKPVRRNINSSEISRCHRGCLITIDRDLSIPRGGHVIVSHKSSAKFKLDNNPGVEPPLKSQRKVQTFLDHPISWPTTIHHRGFDRSERSHRLPTGNRWQSAIPVIDEIRGPTDSYSTYLDLPSIINRGA